MSDALTALTDATFDEEVSAADVPVLVDFWAEWCGPCKLIAPILEELAVDHAGRLRIFKVDVESQTVVISDVWSFTSVQKFVTFIAVGLVTLAISFLYTRYKDALKEYL